jgi:hypothetical protein
MDNISECLDKKKIKITDILPAYYMGSLYLKSKRLSRSKPYVVIN